MKKIGVLFGMENSFPGALVEHINARQIDGIHAEFVQTGAVHLDKPAGYAVIVDRISHDIPVLSRLSQERRAQRHGRSSTIPFWWSADDKFFNYTLAAKLGVAVPPTVILPHKKHPAGTTDRSMRNLEYPLDWEAVFDYVGVPGFMKPVDGGGWRDVYHIHNREEFFQAYDQIARALHDVPEGGRSSRSTSAATSSARKGPHHALRSAASPSRALCPGPAGLRSEAA